MKHSILIIEDEPTIARLLSYNLTQAGYEVTVIEHGGTGLQTAMDSAFDLIILDIMLPGINGFEIMQKLRSRGIRTPVIFLTARDTEEEVVEGLKRGADDYMTKPFGVAELLARVAAVLRRTAAGDYTEEKEAEGDVITAGELVIYPERYEVSLRGEMIALRPKEFEVLLHLVHRPGIVITRDDLMNKVWGFDYIGGQRTVDVHVSSLRKKLELNQQSVRIDAIRGVGYKLIIEQ